MLRLSGKFLFLPSLLLIPELHPPGSHPPLLLCPLSCPSPGGSFLPDLCGTQGQPALLLLFHSLTHASAIPAPQEGGSRRGFTHRSVPRAGNEGTWVLLRTKVGFSS